MGAKKIEFLFFLVLAAVLISGTVALLWEATVRDGVRGEEMQKNQAQFGYPNVACIAGVAYYCDQSGRYCTVAFGTDSKVKLCQ